MEEDFYGFLTNHPGVTRQEAMRLPSLWSAEVGFRMIAPNEIENILG